MLSNSIVTLQHQKLLMSLGHSVTLSLGGRRSAAKWLELML